MDLESKYCYFYHSWDFVPYKQIWIPLEIYVNLCEQKKLIDALHLTNMRLVFNNDHTQNTQDGKDFSTIDTRT
jgi:hypothetical protein